MKTIAESSVLKYIAAWILLPVIAILNGLLRELTYSYMAGETLAHQVSAIILILFILFYIIVLNTRLSLKNTWEALAVGLSWLSMTVIFETALGLIRGITWQEQIQVYNILDGNFWVLVLLSVFLGPVLLRNQKISLA